MLKNIKYKSIHLLFCIFIISEPAWCYRPFESTDADVVDAREIEIELGYMNWERSGGDDTFITPQLVFNYGLSNFLELVMELEVEHPDDGNSQLVDPAIFLKTVLREGVMQEQACISFAVEGGLLLPSTIEEEDKAGLEAVGILSGRISPVTYHINFGGGLDRIDRRLFGLWGFIVELPLKPDFRLVGEINGESIRGERAENSGLIGMIWEPPSFPDLILDAGIRHGLSRNSPNWGVTLGLSFSF